MNIRELLATTAHYLKENGISNPKTSGELLLAHVLCVTRKDLYLDFENNVPNEKKKEFLQLCDRRKNGEPIQYILGDTEFISLPFQVNEYVLIPRHETELLVEKVMSYCSARGNGGTVRILDIGTGSGNIAVSLAHYMAGAHITAIEVNREALKIARENAARNGVDKKITFVAQNIFDAKTADFSDIDVVVSNPPYIHENDHDCLEKDVVDYEPHEALFAGRNNLIFYETITSLAVTWLKQGGLLAFEIGYDTGIAVSEIVENSSFHTVKLSQDYAGHDRIVTGIR